MSIDVTDELSWIYHTLQQRKGVYLLENIVDSAKSYSASSVHEWGAEVGNSIVYEKIKDLIKVRIFEAVEGNILDKQLAGEILKTYYYKPFSDLGEGKGETVIKIEILQEEAAL